MEAIKPQDLHNEIGKKQSTSWFVVNQEMINTFADVTDDPQFIHVDPEMNYGYDKIRFISPVPVDSKCRYNSTLVEVTEKPGDRWLLKFAIELEIEGQEKPGFVAENLAMIFV